MTDVYYPSIKVKLYNFNNVLLHSFNCKSIGDWKDITCKAFYVSNYKSHNKAYPLYHELDININYKRYYVRMEAVKQIKEKL